MALETVLMTAVSTRRALLAGSLGALGAYFAQAFGQPRSVRATDGDVIHVGDELTATSVTKITNTANADPVFWAESSSGVAVVAKSSGHDGIQSHSLGSSGVTGTTNGGRGLYGIAFDANGTGVRAEAPGGGTALQVAGRAKFSTSGRLTFGAGQSSIFKTGVPVGGLSLVLAVLQTNRPGIYVRAVVPYPSTDSFRIYLNAAVPGTTHVAWFVLEH